MSIFVAGVGAIVSVALLLVSAYMNFSFGQQLASDPFDKVAYGLASASGDGLKAIVPFAIAWGWRARRYFVVAASVLVFTAATAYSLASAFGFAAATRVESAGGVKVEIARLDALRDELALKQTERAGLPAARPTSTIQAEMEGAETHERWRSSNGCTNATVSRSIAFCERYTSLRVELATAERAVTLDREIDGLRKAVREASLNPRVLSRETDPQVSSLSSLFGVDREEVRVGLTILVALFVEIGSGLGLFVSFAHLGRAEVKASTRRAKPATSNPEADADWALTRLIIEGGVKTPSTELYRDYVAYCLARSRDDAMTQSAFDDWLSREGLASQRKIDGVWYRLGVRLREPEDVVVPLRRAAARSR